MKSRMLFAMVGMGLIMCGCSHTSDLAKLELADQTSTSLSFRVESSLWPSRWVYFEPTKVARMSAYREPVYQSIIDIRLTNSGLTACTVRYLANEHRIEPRDTLELKGVKFSELRLSIAPAKDTSAELTMELAFDRNYSTTGTWRLVGAWADGP